MEVQNEIKNTADDMRDVIVSVEHLKTYFNAGKTWGKKQVVKAVDDVCHFRFIRVRHMVL